MEKYPIWTMCYRGGMLVNSYDPSECFMFLKKALLLSDPDCPIRGPSFYKDNGYIYRNGFEGEIPEFTGSELIEYAGIKIYSRNYLGGYLKKVK